MKLKRIVYDPFPNMKKRPRAKDKRESAAKRGYSSSWRKIREEVLRNAGIPFEDWSLYDVDHNPPYNKWKEPDHSKYTLIPRLHSEHSRKTATCDVKRDKSGRFIKKK